MKTTIALVSLLLCAGCATAPGQAQMSPEQLKALTADKNFTAVCSTVLGPWGTGKFVYTNVDKSVVINGAISVDANCLVTMSNDQITPKAIVVTQPPTAPVK